MIIMYFCHLIGSSAWISHAYYVWLFIQLCILSQGGSLYKYNWDSPTRTCSFFHVLRSDEQSIICWKRSYVHVLLLLVLFNLYLSLYIYIYIYVNISDWIGYPLPCASKKRFWYDPMINLSSTYKIKCIYTKLLIYDFNGIIYLHMVLLQ